MRKIISGAGRASLVTGVALALVIGVGMVWPAQAMAKADPKAIPVLLVHGGLGSSADFLVMKQRLADDGYRPFTVDLGIPSVETARDASTISARIKEIQDQTGASKVHLVAHSMGGVAGRYYIKILDGGRNVATYTAFGTPQHGNPNPVGCVLVKDQCPRGPTLQKLNAGDDTPGSVYYTSIGSTDQAEEKDGTWSRLDGGACLPLVAGGPHGFEPSNPVIYATVLDGLNARCPGGFVTLPEITP